MTEWVAKRFWTEVTVAEVEAGAGFQVLLDGRGVKSPGKRLLTVPSRTMAEAAAAEWAAQDEVIDPTTMPVTRTANSAHDQTAPQREGVIAMLAAYAETDLLCHRADAPETLVARQAQAWDPLLEWVAKTHGAELKVTAGLLPEDQPGESLDALRAAVAGYGNFGLTGLYDLITLSGSIVIGLAVADGRLDAETGWRVSRIDEDWQSEQWGEDEDAAALAATKRAAFLHAAQVVGWSGQA